MSPTAPIDIPGSDNGPAQEPVGQAFSPGIPEGAVPLRTELPYKVIFERSVHPMVLINLADDVLVDVNDAFCRTHGIKRSDAIGRPADSLAVAPFEDLHAKVSRLLIENGSCSDVDVIMRRADGTSFHGLLTAHLVLVDGRPHILGTTKDVTRERELERALDRERLVLRSVVSATNIETFEYTAEDDRITVWESGGQSASIQSGADASSYSLEHLLSRVHPDDLPGVREKIAEHFRGDSKFYDAAYRVPDGCDGWRWVHTRGAVTQRHKDGRPIVMVGVRQDHTEHQLESERHERALSFHRMLLSLAIDFINVAADRQEDAIRSSLAAVGQFLHVDRAYLFTYDFVRGIARNTHEWNREGVAKRREFLQDVPLDTILDWVDEHKNGRTVCEGMPTYEAGSAAPSFEHTERYVITVPIMDAGQCTGFVGFDPVLLNDQAWLSEGMPYLRLLAELYMSFARRRAADQNAEALKTRMAAARDEANAAAKAKNLFLANMSHEIRTPLNAILGYSQLLTRECRSCPAYDRLLKPLTRSGEHLLDLTTDLLELARNDGRSIELASSDFDLASAVEDVRLMFLPNAVAKGLTLDVTLVDDLPHTVHGDRGKIRQVLVNLVSNAIKATDKGHITITVDHKPGTSHNTRQFVIAVSDTGCGLDAEDVERIFDARYLAARPSGGPGSGLGLSLSRQLAQAMRGHVSATSQKGTGSTFRFTFCAWVVGGEPTCGRRSVSRLLEGQRPFRLLIVEDDQDSVAMMSEMLSTVGFEVASLGSGETAVQHLSAGSMPDVILMDKMLPGIGGYETIRRVRQLPGGDQLKFIVVTASGLAEEEEASRVAGADGYVPKPIKAPRLFEEIRQLTGAMYEYVEHPDHRSPIPAAVPPTGASELPSELRQRMLSALRRGDITSIRALASEIGRLRPDLANDIDDRVTRYDYEAIVHLLHPVS